jgi:hypothetical protein
MANFADRPAVPDRYTRAVQLATILHGTQLRKDGSLYVGHLQAVAAGCLQFKDVEAAIVAWFHDTLEDLPGAIAETELDIEPIYLDKPIFGRDYSPLQERFGRLAMYSIGKYHNGVNRGRYFDKDGKFRYPPRVTRREWLEMSTEDRADSVRLALEELIESEFGEQTLETVRVLTEDKSLPKRERKWAYGHAIATTTNKQAVLVSLMDKWHNLDWGYSLEGAELDYEVIEFYQMMIEVFRTRFNGDGTTAAEELVNRMHQRLNLMCKKIKGQ